MNALRSPASQLPLLLAFQLGVALIRPGDGVRFSLYFGLLLLLGYLGRGSWGWILRACWILPLTLCGLPMLFTTPGPGLGQLGSWTVTQPGLEKFLAFQARAWLSLAASLWLLGQHPARQLLGAFQALKLPWLFTALVSMMLSYVEVLGQEFRRMQVARAARSAASRAPSWRWQVETVGHQAGTLMLRSQLRAQRVHEAMVSRGYRGGPLPEDPPPGPCWWLVLPLGVLLIGLSQWP